MAGGQVDVAQPRVSETRTPVRGSPGRLVVRAAMHEAPRGGEKAVRRHTTPTGYRREDAAQTGAPWIWGSTGTATLSLALALGHRLRGLRVRRIAVSVGWLRGQRLAIRP